MQRLWNFKQLRVLSSCLHCIRVICVWTISSNVWTLMDTKNSRDPSLHILRGMSAKTCRFYISYNAARSIKMFQAYVPNKLWCWKHRPLVTVLSHKSQPGTELFSKAFKRSHSVDSVQILTHHECGCKTCRWEPRVQSPPGWRAWRSGQRPGVDADHPPSWGAAAAHLCQHIKTGHSAQKLGRGGGVGVFMQFISHNSPSRKLVYNRPILTAFISYLLVNLRTSEGSKKDTGSSQTK